MEKNGSAVQESEEPTRRFGKAASELASQAASYMHTGERYVENHPKAGVGMAVLFGMALGSLFTLIFRRR
ncbi:MAG: hypothetical protein AB7F86_02290 [Bdellovibrionales bacterium]